MYPALESESSGGILGSSIKGLAESYGLMGLGSAPTYNIPDIVLSRRIKKNIILSKWQSNAFPDSSNLIKFWEIDKPNKFSPFIILDVFKSLIPVGKVFQQAQINYIWRMRSKSFKDLFLSVKSSLA